MSPCFVSGCRRALMKDLQRSDCEVVSADKKIRRPSINGADCRFRLGSGVVCKVIPDFAQTTHRVPTRRERSDTKPNIGQGHRYPGGECRFLCRNNKHLQFGRVSVRSCHADCGTAAAVHRLARACTAIDNSVASRADSGKKLPSTNSSSMVSVWMRSQPSESPFGGARSSDRQGSAGSGCSSLYLPMRVLDIGRELSSTRTQCASALPSWISLMRCNGGTLRSRYHSLRHQMIDTVSHVPWLPRGCGREVDEPAL